jgi:hypothetical protein
LSRSWTLDERRTAGIFKIQEVSWGCDLLIRLKKTGAADKKFDARFKVLAENVLIDFLKEERKSLPKTKKTPR